MQNVQNNFTVENIVAKYRNYVMEHCPKSCEFNGYEQFDAPISPYWESDEQLLVTIYKKVAGNKADSKVLKVLTKYADAYYSEAISEAELSFLCSNIGTSVNYIFLHLKDTVGNFSTIRPGQTMANIIKENAIMKDGSTIFIDNNNGDLAGLPSCQESPVPIRPPLPAIPKVVRILHPKNLRLRSEHRSCSPRMTPVIPVAGITVPWPRSSVCQILMFALH